MTGTVHTQNPVYSRLTFALLEDSGWYLPNYELVSYLIFLFLVQISFKIYMCFLAGIGNCVGQKSRV